MKKKGYREHGTGPGHFTIASRTPVSRREYVPRRGGGHTLVLPGESWGCHCDLLLLSNRLSVGLTSGTMASLWLDQYMWWSAKLLLVYSVCTCMLVGWWLLFAFDCNYCCCYCCSVLLLWLSDYVIMSGSHDDDYCPRHNYVYIYIYANTYTHIQWYLYVVFCCRLCLAVQEKRKLYYWRVQWLCDGCVVGECFIVTGGHGNIHRGDYSVCMLFCLRLCFTVQLSLLLSSCITGECNDSVMGVRWILLLLGCSGYCCCDIFVSTVTEWAVQWWD